MLAVEAAPDTFELMVSNTAHLGSVVTPVHAALVSQVQADTAPTVVFGGRENDFWGFRVDGGMKETDQFEQVSYEVPAKSLRSIRVRLCMRPTPGTHPPEPNKAVLKESAVSAGHGQIQAPGLHQDGH